MFDHYKNYQKKLYNKSFEAFNKAKGNPGEEIRMLNDLWDKPFRRDSERRPRLRRR